MPIILIVDDDDGHLLIAQRAIRRSELEVEVHAVRTGEEALRILGLGDEALPVSRGTRPVVVISISRCRHERLGRPRQIRATAEMIRWSSSSSAT
jgi:CheY-like chemotaxis protein